MAESTIPDERVLDVLRASAVFGRPQESVLQNRRRLRVLHPLPINPVFARAIHNPVRRASQVVEQRHVQTFVVVPMHDGAGAHAMSVSLTQALAKVGRALHLTPQLELAPDRFVTQVWQGKDRYNELEEQYDFPIMGDGRAAQIVEVGYRYAMQEVATWKTAEGKAA